jgi:hypothetical protein
MGLVDALVVLQKAGLEKNEKFELNKKLNICLPKIASNYFHKERYELLNK